MTPSPADTSAAPRPRVHLQVPVGGRPGSDIASVLDLARRAEDAGFDGIVVVDHVVMSDETDGYPFGAFNFEPTSPWIDPLVALAAVGAVTERLELVTSVVVVPVRAPAVLAKQVATLEQLAPGRVVLGVGVGWQPAEFGVNRVAFDQRGQLLDDTMTACRALWRDAPASVDTPTVRFDGLWCEPRPQAGAPRVLVSGSPGARTARRIGAWADGWMPHPQAPDDEIATTVPRLRQAWEAAGRDGELAVHAMRAVAGPDGTSDVAATLGRLDDWAAMGITSVALPLAAFVAEPDGWDDWFAQAAEVLGGAAQ